MIIVDYTGVWLLNNNLALVEDDTITVKLSSRFPDYEYETLARIFFLIFLGFSVKKKMKKL